MAIFNCSNYEQSLLHILEYVVPEAVSDDEMMLQRTHEMGWQNKVNCGYQCTSRNGLS